MEKNSSKVCVTGGAGFIGSWLVKKLLQKGHVVHATLRNLGEESKTGLLKSLPGADTRLLLFQADIYNADKFETAIQGCEFVFLVATPMQHNANSSKYKDISEAAIGAMQIILQSCERSGSVKRVIYTGSVTATSPLKEDGIGFKDFMNESCWTPLNLSYAYSEDHEKLYTFSKTLSEKEALSYTKEEKRGIEVVSLACGLVGGDTLLPYAPTSIQSIVSPLTGNQLSYRQLRFLQALLGSVPLVHVDDVCEAHAFCMEKPSMAGRFLCTTSCPTIPEIADYYQQNYPELRVMTELEGPERKIQCSSTKLEEMGFKYNYDLKQILDDTLDCAKRVGALT